MLVWVENGSTRWKGQWLRGRCIGGECQRGERSRGGPGLSLVKLPTPGPWPIPSTMSFGLSRGRELDPGFTAPPALPPLPDDLLTNPTAGHMDLRAWFADPLRRFELEIGSGKGTFLMQTASRQPLTNFLGIEYAQEFYLYAADRLRRAGMTNVRMLGLDASAFLQWRTASGICDVIHLYFADPWPKTKHHRRRMVQDGFLAEALRILKPGGELRIVTDHADYWRWMEEHFARWAGPESAGGPEDVSKPFDRRPFTPVLPASDDTDDGEGPTASAGKGSGGAGGELVGTNFERKYRVEGRSFYSTVLVKPLVARTSRPLSANQEPST